MGAYHARMAARYLWKAIEGCRVLSYTEEEDFPVLQDAQEKAHVLAKALEAVVIKHPEGKRVLEGSLKRSRMEV